MIHLDAPVLIHALCGKRRLAPALRRLIERGERIEFSSLVLYEWTRGPRRPEEIATQMHLFPNETAVGFGPSEARIAAELYRAVPRARQREIDLAIAACAIAHRARLWTLNPRDFGDIPALSLHREIGRSGV